MSPEYDALLVLSFGGPEGPADVRPFLENVTRGRGIPAARLDEVAQHYLHFGGVSPINRLTRDIVTSIERHPLIRDLNLPVYLGNRNWHPMAEDTVARMADDGVRSALVFATSAWGGYSGCKQYHEDIARARAAVGPRAPELHKLRQFYDHPVMIAMVADAIRAAVAGLPAADRSSTRLVFTAHSIPIAADVAAGPIEAGGRLYSNQVREASRLAAAAAGFAEFDVVWQSRSGPPQIPWLEPDIGDHLAILAAGGVTSVVVCPIGFVSDHLEVIWDLDTEAAQDAERFGMSFARAGTVGTDPRFADLVADLVTERVTAAAPSRLGEQWLCGADGGVLACSRDCCPTARRGSSPDRTDAESRRTAAAH
ncbi:ferrochelatase [Millisia brevis]|uniref:ferrochelatase n=1 Tax=Millisia brevis TaxID=264148 RepID=UPI0008315009|nr:ferrochelatase [Millisia brevis]